jgi:hypothetical protein
MLYILGLAVFWLVYGALTRNSTPPPAPMTEQQLMDEGMTRAEARKELRAQRNEQRIHSQTNSQAIRTANQISRTVNQYFKKRK